MRFAVTGTFTTTAPDGGRRWITRNDIELLFRMTGWRLESSVGPNTDVLFAENEQESGGKLSAARARGISIRGYPTLYNILGERLSSLNGSTISPLFALERAKRYGVENWRTAHLQQVASFSDGEMIDQVTIGAMVRALVDEPDLRKDHLYEVVRISESGNGVTVRDDARDNHYLAHSEYAQVRVFKEAINDGLKKAKAAKKMEPALPGQIAITRRVKL